MVSCCIQNAVRVILLLQCTAGTSTLTYCMCVSQHEALRNVKCLFWAFLNWTKLNMLQSNPTKTNILSYELSHRFNKKWHFCHFSSELTVELFLSLSRFSVMFFMCLHSLHKSMKITPLCGGSMMTPSIMIISVSMFLPMDLLQDTGLFSSIRYLINFQCLRSLLYLLSSSPTPKPNHHTTLCI